MICGYVCGWSFTYVVAYYVTHKFDLVNKFIQYKSMMKNQLYNKIKRIRNDNGGEYMK